MVCLVTTAVGIAIFSLDDVFGWFVVLVGYSLIV